MDGTAQWPQGIGVVKASVENSTSYANNNPSIEKKPRPQKERALHCPRCRSTNTKFCYYNNYSLSQPRYLCKNCRRYWTEGGTLRNVPVGGGSRKNRRSSYSSLNSSKRSIIIDNNNIAPSNDKLLQNPNKIRQWPDPEFAYHDQWNHGMSEQFIALPSFTVLDVNNTNHQNLVNSSSNTSRIPVMELLKTGNIVSGGLSSSLLPLQVHNSNPSLYSSAGFPLHDQIKPSFNFSLDRNGYGNLQLGFEDLADASRNVPVFAFEELKTVSDSDNQLAQDRGEGGHSNGFKSNGMLTHRSW